MGIQEIRERLGIKASVERSLVVRRAIRAEIPGGGELLDLMELVHQMIRRQACPHVVLDRLHKIRDRMAEAVLGDKTSNSVSIHAGEATPKVSPAVPIASRMPYDDDNAPLSPRRSAPAAIAPPVEPAKPVVHAVRHFATELPDTDRRQHTGIGVVWHPPAAIVARMGKEPDATIAKDAGVSETAVREARQRLSVKAFVPRWSEADDAIVLTLPVERAAAALGRSVASVKTRKSRLKKAVPNAR